MIKLVRNLIDRIYINKKIINYTKRLEKELNYYNKQDYILVDYTSSYSTLITYYHILKILNQKFKISNFLYINNSYIKRFDIIGIPNRNFNYFFQKIMEEFKVNGLNNKEINKLELKNIVTNIQTKEEILNYKIEDLVVGDLIYDTYLKWNKKATVDINDTKKLFQIFFQAHSLYNQIKKLYAQNNKISYFIAGDIAYIYSGISARYLAQRDIKVINFIEAEGLEINFLDKPYFYRRHKYWEYNINTIDNLKHARNISQNELTIKLKEGKQEYIYMGHSAFINKVSQEHKAILDKIQEIDFKVLIPLHCFMDSPHLYRWMCYPDFYEWIKDTLTILEKLNITAIIKPHPNGFPENDRIVENLKKEFKTHIFIDKSISNRIFINMNVDRVLTVYGSVGYEFSYFNIPVISAGDNPHVAFNFVKTCKSKNEYKEVLKNIKNFTHKIDKNEIYDFYYLHYIQKNFIQGINPIYPFGSFLQTINENDTPQLQRENYHHNSQILDIEMKQIDSNHYDNIETEIIKKWF